jgi:hypothetical protein
LEIPLGQQPTATGYAGIKIIGDLRLLRRDRALPAITRRGSYRADWKAIAGSTFR